MSSSTHERTTVTLAWQIPTTPTTAESKPRLDEPHANSTPLTFDSDDDFHLGRVVSFDSMCSSTCLDSPLMCETAGSNDSDDMEDDFVDLPLYEEDPPCSADSCISFSDTSYDLLNHSSGDSLANQNIFLPWQVSLDESVQESPASKRICFNKKDYSSSKRIRSNDEDSQACLSLSENTSTTAIDSSTDKPLKDNVSMDSSVDNNLNSKSPHDDPTFPPGSENIMKSDIQPSDILSGRGGFTNSHEGNQSFRRVVDCMKPMYRNTTDAALKSVIPDAIVIYMCQTLRARFLKKNTGESSYRIMAHEESRTKVCQALREEMMVQG